MFLFPVRKFRRRATEKKDAISVFVEILSGYDDKVVAVVIAIAVLLLCLDCFAFQFVKGSVSCYPYHVIHPSATREDLVAYRVPVRL